MNLVLLIILFILMIYVCGKRGIKLFFSIIANFLILITSFYIMVIGINAVVISLVACYIICRIVLYKVNGNNIKTKSSMKSIIVVLLLLTLLIFIITNLSRIAGFGYEEYEEINMFSYDIGIDFTNISVALIIIGLIGATIDSSMAISSALYEVKENNKDLNSKELFISGMNIGKDIMGTTMSTLLFAFLGEFMTLLIWFKKGNYSIGDIINSKTFATEFIKIMFSAIGCILVIPITSYITSKDLVKMNSKNNMENDIM